MATRPVLMAACVVARDARTDAAALLDAWTREADVPVNVFERDRAAAAAAVLDEFDTQPFLVAALRGMRPGITLGLHLGTRVNGRGEKEPVEVSARSADGARKLADAGGAGEILLSSDLGAFLSIGRARLSTHLEPARLRRADGPPVEIYRLRGGGTAPSTHPARDPAASRNSTGQAANGGPITNGGGSASTVDTPRRSQLVERLGAMLTPHLGPIAPVMLRRLPAGRMSAREFVEAILKDVPEPQYAAVKRVVEEEIRRLR